jgi:hypothetical protein
MSCEDAQVMIEDGELSVVEEKDRVGARPDAGVVG